VKLGGEMEELLKTNLDTIFNYSLFITGNRERAMDLMQDTIVALLSKQQPYTEESHFKSWIFRVLKNNWINKIKRDSVLGEVAFSCFSDDGDADPLDFRPAPEDFSDPILKEKLKTAFETLPQGYREVVVLVEVEGCSYEEAAKILELPVGTVMSRLHRARTQLRGMFRQEAVELRIISEKDRKNA
jgi:RNA polymerase sigma-70 factor (ECF subfamily)